jgi:hypothetical protein
MELLRRKVDEAEASDKMVDDVDTLVRDTTALAGSARNYTKSKLERDQTIKGKLLRTAF